MGKRLFVAVSLILLKVIVLAQNEESDNEPDFMRDILSFKDIQIAGVDFEIEPTKVQVPIRLEVPVIEVVRRPVPPPPQLDRSRQDEHDNRDKQDQRSAQNSDQNYARNPVSYTRYYPSTARPHRPRESSPEQHRQHPQSASARSPPIYRSVSSTRPPSRRHPQRYDDPTYQAPQRKYHILPTPKNYIQSSPKRNKYNDESSGQHGHNPAERNNYVAQRPQQKHQYNNRQEHTQPIRQHYNAPPKQNHPQNPRHLASGQSPKQNIQLPPMTQSGAFVQAPGSLESLVSSDVSFLEKLSSPDRSTSTSQNKPPNQYRSDDGGDRRSEATQYRRQPPPPSHDDHEEEEEEDDGESQEGSDDESDGQDDRRQNHERYQEQNSGHTPRQESNRVPQNRGQRQEPPSRDYNRRPIPPIPSIPSLRPIPQKQESQERENEDDSDEDEEKNNRRPYRPSPPAPPPQRHQNQHHPNQNSHHPPARQTPAYYNNNNNNYNNRNPKGQNNVWIPVNRNRVQQGYNQLYSNPAVAEQYPVLLHTSIKPYSQSTNNGNAELLQYAAEEDSVYPISDLLQETSTYAALELGDMYSRRSDDAEQGKKITQVPKRKRTESKSDMVLQATPKPPTEPVTNTRRRKPYRESSESTNSFYRSSYKEEDNTKPKPKKIKQKQTRRKTTSSASTTTRRPQTSKRSKRDTSVSSIRFAPKVYVEKISRSSVNPNTLKVFRVMSLTGHPNDTMIYDYRMKIGKDGQPRHHRKATKIVYAYAAPTLNATEPNKRPKNDVSIPECAKSSSFSVCFEDDKYPGAELLQALTKSAPFLKKLGASTKVYLATNETARDLTSQFGSCPSLTSRAYIKRAKNADGEWRIIVNVDVYRQPLIVNICKSPNEKCAHGTGTSKCTQKFVLRRLMAYDSSKGLFVDKFRIPSSCTCGL